MFYTTFGKLRRAGGGAEIRRHPLFYGVSELKNPGGEEMRLIRKTGLPLLGTICMRVGGQGGGIDAEAREKCFSGHAIKEEAISPVSGESYYQ